MDTCAFKIVICLWLILCQSYESFGSTSFFSNDVFNVSDGENYFRDSALHERNNYGLKCTVRPTDEGLHAMLLQLQKRAKLIEFELNIVTGNYSVNPLLLNQTLTYKSNIWARVGSSQGQTILNLAFNYDVLSLKTLSFGIERLYVDLAEEPGGCVGELSEFERIQVVMDIMLRDLNADGPIVVYEGEAAVCHQVIQDRNGTGKFTDRCCWQARDSIDIACYINPNNKYLNILDLLLVFLSLGVFLFGLAFTPRWLYMSTMDSQQYYVKLKEPLYKKLVITSQDNLLDVKAKHIINVDQSGGWFPNFRNLVQELPRDVVIPIKIDEFDISVSYRKMNVENHVPVGIMSCLARAIFQCKLYELGPFEDCCNANVTGCIHKGHLRWKNVCGLFGRVLFVIFLPFPFYIRLVCYYFFEYPEIVVRTAAAESLGLEVDYEFRIMQFLTPTHPLYITLYVVYFFAGIRLAYTAGSKKRPHMQTAIISAFHDMQTKSKLRMLSFIVSKFLLPFRKFGVYGLFAGLIYWPIVMPFLLIAAILYYIPLFYIMMRIIQRAFVKTPLELLPAPEIKTATASENQEPVSFKTKLQRTVGCSGIKPCTVYKRHPVLNMIVVFITFITLFAMMTMLAEVARFMAEIMCFTVMGLIVNAAQVIKYGSMLFMVILYSRDCYNDVNRKYLKLNKALFDEVNKLLGNDIKEFTQLPGKYQQKRGFKAVEASAQGEHEETDDLVTKNVDNYSWQINDMILFIDEIDTPRMPKKLFDQVCQLKVAGCPGPVYKSLVMATGKFAFIILFLAFVFIVVMSFGESNNFSQTSQMLAAMVGGFLPLIFNNLFKSATPQVETNLLSFKAKVGEIISQFQQTWPMTDFIFDIEEPPKDDDEEEEDGDDNKSQGSKSEEKNGDKKSKDDKAKDKKDKRPKDDNAKDKKDEKPNDKKDEKLKDKKDEKSKDKKDEKPKDKKDEKPKDKKGEKEKETLWFVKSDPQSAEDIEDKIRSVKPPDAEGAEVDILVHLKEDFDSSTINLGGFELTAVPPTDYGHDSSITPYVATAGMFAMSFAADSGDGGGLSFDA